MVEIVTSERPELVHEKNKAEQALIAEILAQGNTSSEFDVQDVIGSARTVHAALVLFGVPNLHAAVFPGGAGEGG